MDDEDEIVVARSAVVVHVQFRCRNDSGQVEETKTLHMGYSISETDKYDAYGTMLPEMKANDMSRYVQ